MTGPIFDTHAHYSARAFDADRDFLLGSLPGKGVVGVCEQATHSGDAPKVLELAHRYPWVVAAVGIHPESLLPAADCGEEGPAPTVSVYGGDWAAEMRALAPYYEDPKVVAVGECGLDYHWPVPKDAQLAMFEAHIRLALELDKPIIVHDRSAHADVYALLKKYRPKGIVHCYSGSADDALWLAEQGGNIRKNECCGQPCRTVFKAAQKNTDKSFLVHHLFDPLPEIVSKSQKRHIRARLRPFGKRLIDPRKSKDGPQADQKNHDTPRKHFCFFHQDL